MQVLLQYQSKSYYIIGQEVYYSIGRFYYIIGQLLHYRAFFITLSGTYYSIGRLLHYRLVQRPLLTQHNSNDTTTPSSSSRSIRHYNNNSTTPSRFNIGTFNVRGLSSATKRNQLSEDLGRLHIDICCLQETKCPGGFDEHPGNYRLIGLQSQSRHYGLAFAVASHMEDRIVRYWSESDRIALIQLRLARNSLLTIINVYGPTSQRVNNNNAEQDEFFSDLAHLTSQYMSCALFYIAGDFNSKIGPRKYDEDFMGIHSLGRRNINGNALADFLEVHSLFICNTAFQHSARHKTTWQGQRRDAATGQVVPIYNVIDFVICRQSHKRLLVDSRTYAGTLLDSDHRLLTAKVNLTQLYDVWGRIEKVRTSKRVRYNTCLLANEPYRAKFCDAVSEYVTRLINLRVYTMEFEC